MIKLYNTLTRKSEDFDPLAKEVKVYSCGPTVYNYVHVGNLRAFVFADILNRVLKYNDYKVKHVMNITDVGHLTDDADQGEDKMEKGSKREGKSAFDIAEMYTKAFFENIKELNVTSFDEFPKATDHIKEQIDQVQQLIDKGFTYETKDGIYFDTTKLSDYGKLANLKKQDLKAGARVELGDKKNSHDFALWKFSKEGENRQMEWEAFGKKGFPGWHIECSAMSMKYLGDQFDIHTGGIDHIPVHHTNEIAQAEGITDKKPWVKYWLHNEFLNIGSEKMAKSGDNFITLQTIKDKGYSPLAYRYFLLQTHYRKQINFSWEAMDAAAQGLKNLRDHVARLSSSGSDSVKGGVEDEFTKAINNDLNTPEALAAVWEAVKEGNITLDEIKKIDSVLGLNLVTDTDIPKDVQDLLEKRQQARENGDWQGGDKIRDEIKSKGYLVEDTDEGQRVIKQ